MSKKSRRAASKRRAAAPAASAQSAQSAQSRPSPAPKKPREAVAFVERPFEGLAAEADLVAMREILPLATLPATTTEEYGSADVVLTTILPSMAGALRRADGVLLVAAQTVMSSGDASRDIAARIIDGIKLPDGQALQVSDLPEPGPRLQDVVASFGELELHEIPSFWMTEEDAAKPENKEALEDSRSQLVPMKGQARASRRGSRRAGKASRGRRLFLRRLPFRRRFQGAGAHHPGVGTAKRCRSRRTRRPDGRIRTETRRGHCSVGSAHTRRETRAGGYRFPSSDAAMNIRPSKHLYLNIEG